LTVPNCLDFDMIWLIWHLHIDSYDILYDVGGSSPLENTVSLIRLQLAHSILTEMPDHGHPIATNQFGPVLVDVRVNKETKRLHLSNHFSNPFNHWFELPILKILKSWNQESFEHIKTVFIVFNQYLSLEAGRRYGENWRDICSKAPSPPLPGSGAGKTDLGGGLVGYCADIVQIVYGEVAAKLQSSRYPRQIKVQSLLKPDSAGQSGRMLSMLSQQIHNIHCTRICCGTDCNSYNSCSCLNFLVSPTTHFHLLSLKERPESNYLPKHWMGKGRDWFSWVARLVSSSHRRIILKRWSI
jgi:hypothetical protein